MSNARGILGPSLRVALDPPLHLTRVRRRRAGDACVLAALAAAFCAPFDSGCASVNPSDAQGSTGAAGGGGPAGATGEIHPSAGDGGIDLPLVRQPEDTQAGCGNGVLDPGELCDDGNSRSGDGCSASCRVVEPDFSCEKPGSPCVYQVKCGDGVLGGDEQCDPPRIGGGCGADCRFEVGYVCDPPPASPPANGPSPPSCHKTVCGDGDREGTESCDDGNVIDGDGCSGVCSFEPDCSSGTCLPRCGDGIRLAPEACDDGNAVSGDGCSKNCEIEAGFSCVDGAPSLPPRLDLLVHYRDFISFPVGNGSRHPDFEIFSGMAATPMLVEPVLDPDGKPRPDGRCARPGVVAECPYGQQLSSTTSLGDWYRDVPGENLPVVSDLSLARQPDGSYVYDSGKAGFYPVDDAGFCAAIPPLETTALADGTVNDGGPHNFGFTTEIRYFLQYRGGESLGFGGDDDTWVFLNRRLAIDLGGLHPPLVAKLDLDTRATGLGLTKGGLYEVAIFQAERHSTGSNFKLTLTGFTPTSTVCHSTCGDGVVARPAEQCDDGNHVDGDGCSHACRFELVIP